MTLLLWDLQRLDPEKRKPLFVSTANEVSFLSKVPLRLRKGQGLLQVCALTPIPPEMTGAGRISVPRQTKVSLRNDSHGIFSQKGQQAG